MNKASYFCLNLFHPPLLFSGSVMPDSLRPHGLQHARLSCPSLSPGVWSNSCSLSQWCHPTISSFAAPSPSVFNHSQQEGLFQWVGPSHQAAKVLVFQIQHQSFQWVFRVDFTYDWLVWSWCPRDSQEPTSTTIQKHQFFGTQPSLWSNSHIHAWLLEKPQLWLHRLWSAQQCLCFLICCLDLS